MTEEIIIRKAEPVDIPTIGFLAWQIWPEAYGKILTDDQLSYMLDLIYSPVSLRRQMNVEKQVFLIAERDEEAVGYASYSRISEPGFFKLHKLYVLPTLQGMGLGKALLKEVIEQVKEQGARALQLNVNRHNKALSFYEKEGFRILYEKDIPIGNGFFMNDYIMEKEL